MTSVLVIDDESQIRRTLKAILEAHGYAMFEAAQGGEGLELAVTLSPDTIILDLGLPDQPGEKILKQLRKWFTKPILILSVKDQDEIVASCLDSGADDYIRKPFGAQELLARIRACIRHHQLRSETDLPLFCCEGFVMDFQKREVWVNNQRVKLTVTEYKLLQLLVRHAGSVVTHRQILTQVWGPQVEDESPYIKVYIQHLRQKLEKTPHRPAFILTETGVGYRFKGEI